MSLWYFIPALLGAWIVWRLPHMAYTMVMYRVCTDLSRGERGIPRSSGPLFVFASTFVPRNLEAAVAKGRGPLYFVRQARDNRDDGFRLVALQMLADCGLSASKSAWPKWAFYDAWGQMIAATNQLALAREKFAVATYMSLRAPNKETVEKELKEQEFCGKEIDYWLWKWIWLLRLNLSSPDWWEMIRRRQPNGILLSMQEREEAQNQACRELTSKPPNPIFPKNGMSDGDIIDLGLRRDMPWTEVSRILHEMKPNTITD